MIAAFDHPIAIFRASSRSCEDGHFECPSVDLTESQVNIADARSFTAPRADRLRPYR